ncbi:MAG: hypothetical protein J6X18_12325 [Bacteroidales bacterium]|nr:hypothetical protein [Bacteroidales bacterium]
MSWFAEIVNEAFHRQFVPREKKEGENRDSVGFIPHDKTAFRPGDEVLYTLNTKDGVVDVYGTVVSNNNGESITISTNREKGRETTTRKMWDENGKYNKQLKHCKSWIKPVVDSGNIHFTAEVYEVGYETANDLVVTLNKVETKIPDGTELIVIRDKQKGKKIYYKWPDGEKLGSIDTTKENLGNKILLPKVGEIEPVYVYKNKYDKNYYVDIPAKAMFVDDEGKFYAWNYNLKEGILKYCPWLKEKPAMWATKPGGERKRIIPKH